MPLTRPFALIHFSAARRSFVAANELGGDRLARALEQALASQAPPPAVGLAGLDSALDVFDRPYDRVRAA